MKVQGAFDHLLFMHHGDDGKRFQKLVPYQNGVKPQ